MRARTDINTKKQRQVTLGNFRGVDFSSSPLNVNKSRATEMQNLICDFGINRKRNGWRELYRFGNSGINGIYDCEPDNSYLVHAGTAIYRVDKASESVERLIDNADDKPSTAFNHYDELYILCGKFMVYRKDENDKYTLLNIDEKIAYIPTTTISINHLDESGAPTGTQHDLELTNGLTGWRKNSLVGTAATSENPATYQLDGKINAQKAIKITAELTTGVKEMIIAAGVTSYDDESIKVSVDYGDENALASKISFYTDTSPQISGESNITVEFYSAYAERIDISKCTFGMKFGADGNTDRLFLGGHPDYPNEDFYSEQDNFLYFPPGHKTTFGTDSAPIMAYARLADTTQIIYKAENPYETTIYYRTGTNNTVYDQNGEFLKVETVFPITAGGIGEGVVAKRACANFAGDVLMLSSNGVFGISIGENIATSERYAKERSRTINAKLTKHDLSTAVSIVYKNRYYLAVDGVCYIADARYKYVPEDSVDGSYNYEWWYWTNIPACTFAQIDGELYFGTNDGRICKFDSEYTDRDKRIAYEGDYSIKINENVFCYNPNGELESISDGDTITILEDSDAVHVLFADTCRVKQGRIVDVGEYVTKIYEGMAVWVDNVGKSGLMPNTPYYITDIDRGDCSFALSTVPYSSENTVKIRTPGFRLSRRLNGTPWLIGGVDGETFYLYTKWNDELVRDTLITYNGAVPTSSGASFVHHTNVVAKWYSAVMDLGSNVMAKTLLKLTIAVEPDGCGPLSFGYETRMTSANINGKSMRGFSFEDIDFNDFTFETGFASSYTVRVKERNFNYVMFRFISDSHYPCSVHDFTATYVINKENRGIS